MQAVLAILVLSGRTAATHARCVQRAARRSARHKDHLRVRLGDLGGLVGIEDLDAVGLAVLHARREPACRQAVRTKVAELGQHGEIGILRTSRRQDLLPSQQVIA